MSLLPCFISFLAEPLHRIAKQPTHGSHNEGDGVGAIGRVLGAMDEEIGQRGLGVSGARREEREP